MPHVMIIEDDALARRSMAFRAMDAHWRVTTLADGRELERMLRDEPADLLLIDLGLPHVDGLALVEDLRAHGIDVPVLVITAHELPHLRETVLGMGANDLMQKPFDPDDLMYRMTRLLAA
ncbi:MAG: response regulator [Flavobacteriales bacterium]|nr:response regulator [Flavobacteriales bacterium]